jgi:hypothetical protein
MNRKSEKYVIQAQARKRSCLTIKIQPPLLKTIKTDCRQRNRPFLDVLNYQMGVFYDKQNNQKKALFL